MSGELKEHYLKGYSDCAYHVSVGISQIIEDIKDRDAKRKLISVVESLAKLSSDATKGIDDVTNHKVNDE